MRLQSKIFITACFVFLLLLLAGCKEPAPVSFSVLVRPDRADSEVKLWRADGSDTYYLFLPSDADRSALTPICPEGSVSVDGIPLRDMESTDLFSTKDEFSLSSNNRTCSVRLIQSRDLPAVCITAAPGALERIHADKDRKETASVSVYEDGRLTLDNAPLSYIKGRGNTTWYEDKKPYNIKFEEKTNLFGMGGAKKWVLLANAQPLADVKNAVAFDLARKMSFPFTPEYAFADLYINGEYQGVYQFCEKVEIGKQRLNIYDLEKANEEANLNKAPETCACVSVDAEGGRIPDRDYLNCGERRWYSLENTPEDITRGYLIELTEAPTPASAFCTARGQRVRLRTPEYASGEELNYIADLYQAAEDALFSPDGYNAEGKYYTDYFDLASLVDMYLIREFTMDCDAGQGSAFFYKPTAEDKLFAGPVWDFDRSMNLSVAMYDANCSGWWANSMAVAYAHKAYKAGRYVTDSASAGYSFLTAAYRHEDFREAVRVRWSELSGLFRSAAELAYSVQTKLSAAAQMDRIRWAAGEKKQAQPEDDHRNFSNLLNFITARNAALNKGFSTDSAMLYYDANGGEGVSCNLQILSVGEKARLIGVNAVLRGELLTESLNFSDVEGLITPPSPEYGFVGWNTAPDGGGETYQPGEEYTLTEKTNVLYAQWKKK